MGESARAVCDTQLVVPGATLLTPRVGIIATLCINMFKNTFCFVGKMAVTVEPTLVKQKI